MERIEQIASEIRKYINRPRKQNLLLKNNKFWNQLCSSLDVVEDTDLALQSYLENDFPEESGEKYLRVYGTLQVIVVQQDAVKNLIEALRLPYTPPSSLKEIRDIRIKSIGHPTKTGWKKGEETYHFISRITMSKDGFDLISSHPDENDEFIKINVPELIAKQRKIISKILKDIHENLKKEEKQHKEQFKNEKLIDIFPQTLGYYFSKMYETLYSKTYPKSFGKKHLKYVKETLNKFKQALEKRKLWGASDSINHLYDELSFPIQELKKYFETEDQSEPADKQARINLFFIEKQIDELKEMAKEIDEDYRKSEIKRINYKGEIFISEELNHDLIDILTSKDNLLIISHGQPPYKVVLGVPHQAAIGEEYICKESEKRPSDENAASYAIAAFAKLKEKDIPCKLVIMAHSTKKDPNKEDDSPYWHELFDNLTELIFECHGARKERQLDLELSAGQNKLAETEKFSRLLGEKLGHNYDLGIQKKAGTNSALIIGTDGTEKDGKLEMPANETSSLREAGKKGIPALHLEAKPQFRIPDNGSNSITPDGFILGRALAQAIIEFDDYKKAIVK